MGNVMGIFAV